ncbi:uncharacterized protein L203_103965 [Cryptococcus depauperatus CBS 7841]|uniref:UBC core domain-containing protein n=1 Tax=Cryptococcus depauperatus CBS 7841 TaxID=1295531 RepID=A0A1E3HUP7_9TREE|nr:ubiquitin-conjugating enzyme 4 [Cryptococcus depauperatus CBS 7841]ODO01028.1 ubiquitin-conjugating enzyme 4 [Cryptococcus depauperatus CBS 7855]
MPPRPLINNEMATKRIKKEIADLAKEDLGSIYLAPEETNILHWKARIPGPVGSPYEGGIFDVSINVPNDYPFSPPHLQFQTKVYHCNVSSNGAICLDLLKTAWSPALSLYKVILSLSSLLTDPNPSDPLVPSIAKEYRSNRKKHDATAREWVQKYALPKPPSTSLSRIAKPAAPRPAALRRTISRPLPPSASGELVSAPQLVGQRRVILEVDESDEEGDVQVLGESSRGNDTVAVTSGARDGSGQGGRKRARMDGRGSSHADAIVVDE